MHIHTCFLYLYIYSVRLTGCFFRGVGMGAFKKKNLGGGEGGALWNPTCNTVSSYWQWRKPSPQVISASVSSKKKVSWNSMVLMTMMMLAHADYRVHSDWLQLCHTSRETTCPVCIGCLWPHHSQTLLCGMTLRVHTRQLLRILRLCCSVACGTHSAIP